MTDAHEDHQARSDRTYDAACHANLGPSHALKEEPHYASRAAALTARTSPAASRPRWNRADPTTHTSTPYPPTTVAVSLLTPPSTWTAVPLRRPSSRRASSILG